MRFRGKNFFPLNSLRIKRVGVILGVGSLYFSQSRSNLTRIPEKFFCFIRYVFTFKTLRRIFISINVLLSFHFFFFSFKVEFSGKMKSVACSVFYHIVQSWESKISLDLSASNRSFFSTSSSSSSSSEKLYQPLAIEIHETREK